MKRIALVIGLVLVGFACAEGVGSMLEDAGNMLADAGDAIRDAGDAMQPDAGAQDTPATCNKGEGSSRWAEFPISSPGQTEVTTCYRADPESSTYGTRAWCQRFVSPWYEGTSTGFLYSCGDHMTSITVHN